VLLPAEDAGCPMADMIEPEDVRRLKEAHPGAAVVCYVNTTTDIKAVSDYCVTSSNAVKVVSSIPEKEIIFIPDRNLGQYVAAKVPDKTFWFFEGFCPTHNFIGPEDVEAIRRQEPDAEILAHPECRPEVLALVDFIGSTGQILRRAKESPNKKIVVCTEGGILHQLRKDNPDKQFVLLSPNLVCTNMKKISLPLVLESLEEMEHRIEVPEDLRILAVKALNRMLSYS
jgi:quinolinate synthase